MGAVISRRRPSARIRLAATGVLVAALAGACSPGGGGHGAGAAGDGIPADVAGALAARADRVAADLGAGACDQALTEARSLQNDLAGLQADPAVRAEALAGAARLTAAIACPPPAAPVPTVADTSPPKKGKDHGHGHEHDG